MEKDLDPAVVKNTQTSLGKYVKRPPLSEKLLKKPPFRFLHDIVTNVLITTGFFEGLFAEEELISENVKDRESKILFLNKVITVVGLTTGKTLSVKPSKIVAGQEPEKTNELLQCLAQALENNLSSTEAVKKYKESANKNNIVETKNKESLKSTKKGNESNKLTSKSTEKLTSQKKDPTVRKKNDIDKVNKPKQKEKTTIKTESLPKKTIQQTKKNTKNPSIDKKTNSSNDLIGDLKNNKNNEIQNEILVNRNSEPIKETEVYIIPEVLSTPLLDQNEQDLNSSYTIADNNLNSNSSSRDYKESKLDDNNETINTEINFENNDSLVDDIKKRKDEVNKEEKDDKSIKHQYISDLEKSPIETRSQDHNKIEDQTTIVKTPTKVKNFVRPLSMRPSSSRPGAPRLREKHDNIVTEPENILIGKVNIIVENTPNEEEEDASIIIVDQADESSNLISDNQEQIQTSLNRHGHLVQQILDSQKEFSHMSGKTEIEWQFRVQKARDATNKEIEQLRFDIQALSRAANPLGKLMDHIQEDVEVMRQEMHQWTKTYEEASKELLKQKAVNEDSLSSLYTKKKQLDADMVEKHEKINDLKIILHKNTYRIEKLLANGNVQ